jgi:sec-independent protein translocase protein TatC
MDPNAQLDSVATPVASPMPRRSRPRWLHVPFRHDRIVPPGSDDSDGYSKTLSGHLIELRNRLVISALSLLPGTILGYLFSDKLIEILKAPLPTKEPLQTLDLTGPFMIHLQVALVAGVILAMPVILFQLWRFISPGLTPKERSAARPWVPLALLFFSMGVGVAYFILPYASGFLYGFQTRDVHLLLTAENYFGFVTMLFLAFGLVMEFPIVLVLLSKVGIVTSKKLRSSRRMAILGITIVSTLITPGADFVSPIAMAVTMYGLYEVSIVMIRMGGR